MKSVFTTIFAIAIIIYTAPLATASDATAGKAAFAKKCASCHGAGGETNAKIASLMKVEMRHLGSKEVQAKSDAELKKNILQGIGKMKPIKVDEQTADDLVLYLRSLAKK